MDPATNGCLRFIWEESFGGAIGENSFYLTFFLLLLTFTYFTHCSSVSVVGCEQVNVGYDEVKASTIPV